MINIGRLYEILPADMHYVLKKYIIEEIRISRNSFPFIKTEDTCFFTEKIVSTSSFDQIISKICNNSYHTHASSIKNGYINAGDGIRVGVCGKAIVENEKIYNINSIDSICIRIPRLIINISDEIILKAFKETTIPNILFYSPPGVGKTTLLRDLVLKLISKPFYKRISLLDTREEIYISQMGSSSLLNVYKGYPKELAFEASIRSMAPDIVVTDEVGSEYESEQIYKYINCGVGVIATTHASSFNDLIKRPFIKKLYENKSFNLYCGIKRQQGKRNFDFVFDQ